MVAIPATSTRTKSAALIGAKANSARADGTPKLTASKTAVAASTTQSAAFGRRKATMIEELKERLTKIRSRLQVTSETNVSARLRIGQAAPTAFVVHCAC